MRARWRNWKTSRRSRLVFVVLTAPMSRITASGLERSSHSMGVGLFVER